MENLDRQITLKFNLVERILLLFKKAWRIQAQKKIFQDFNELKTNFFLKTRHFFSEALRGEEQKRAASVKFHQVVASEDFLGRLGDLVERVMAALEVVEKEQKQTCTFRTDHLSRHGKLFAQNLKRMFEQFFFCTKPTARRWP